MITTQQVEKRLGQVNFTQFNRPTETEIKAITLEGRSRILKDAATDGLCERSNKYFEFCWMTVGRFCSQSYNAVEIAYLVGMQPIHVAAAIQQYGHDWCYRLFTLKRFVGVDRGRHTIMQSTNWFWTPAEIAHRVNDVIGNTRQAKLLHKIRNNRIEEIKTVLNAAPYAILSLIDQKRVPVFRDQRWKQEANRPKGNAMTVKRRIDHELAVCSAPRDVTLPRPTVFTRRDGSSYQYNS